jgi:cytochrome c-type biogenesis protein CcmF
MISVLGNGLVFIALGCAILGSIAGYAAGKRPSPQAWLLAKRLAYGFSSAMIAANLLMVYALVTHDFSVAYVAEVGSRDTPIYFTIVSLWASLNGSILFWGGILGVYVAGTVYTLGDEHKEYAPWTVHFLLGISVFFALLIATIANPFEAVFPVPLDGPGPNPLLQNHWLMAVHPPMLYLGYVGMAVPYSMICAALVAGRLGAGWMTPIRRWTLIPWTFLTFGIVLGGWWSYTVLGWGGAWAWDPVENASFHPWLTGTAFLHSAMVVQRRGTLRDWTLVLGMATFLLTLVGTFMTRSGVFNSVHSFTQSEIGPAFLAFIALTLAVSVALLAARTHTLDLATEESDRRLGNSKGSKTTAWISRESAILIQNVLFSVFTFMVLLGTLMPLIAEAVEGRRITVAEPWFDRYALQVGVPLIFMMGVGPALPWGRMAPEAALKRMLAPTGAAALAVTFALVSGLTSPLAVLFLALCAFAASSNIREFVEPVLARRASKGEAIPMAAAKVFSKGRRRFGAHIAHLGVLLLVFSFTMTKTYRYERDFTQKVGETSEFQGYTITYTGDRTEQQSHRRSEIASFRLAKNGRDVGSLEPMMNFYNSQREPIGTPAVYTTATDDVYISIIEIEPGSHAVFRAIWMPYQTWMWWSAPVITLGSLVILFPGVRRRKKRVAPVEQAAK